MWKLPFWTCRSIVENQFVRNLWIFFVMWTWNGIEVKILNFVGFSEKARNRREKSGLEKAREIPFFLSLWKSRITPLEADVIGSQNKTFADPFLYTITV